MGMRDRTALVGFSSWFAAIVLLLTLGCHSPLHYIEPFTSTCGADSETSAQDREAVDRVALQFVQEALGPNPALAYSAFTTEAKQSLPSEKFLAVFQQVIQPRGPFKNLHVEHTYVAKITGSDHGQRVVCGNLSGPEGWVAVSIRPGPEQAHVIVEGETTNNNWVFVIWLSRERGDWHILYSHFATEKMVGKSAEDLQMMAQLQHQAHRDFNAYILYAAALQLADRGPNFQLGSQPEIQKGIAEVEVPRELRGQPPFAWSFGKSSFKILNVAALGVSGKIYLLIDHEIEPWVDNQDADRKNHDLMVNFATAYPEYRDAFAGLVVRAHERGGNRGWGTVDENESSAK